MAMDPLAALADVSPAGPLGPTPGPAEDMEEMAPEPEGTPEDQDKMMLLEDFRMAPVEDALAAFDALLSAFKVKRS